MILLWVIIAIVVVGVLIAVYMDILNRFDKIDNHIRWILEYQAKQHKACPPPTAAEIYKAAGITPE